MKKRQAMKLATYNARDVRVTTLSKAIKVINREWRKRGEDYSPPSPTTRGTGP